MILAPLFLLFAMNDPTGFLKFAKTPPMGWNSWDCFATTVNEDQTKAQAEVMASKLKSFGWNTIVVDIQWYEPNAKNFEYRANAELALDPYGRLIPAENRFPSSANGKGFKPLADFIHAKGLKFGIHLMRGIPRQAVTRKLPILGTDRTADQIADQTSICPWNPDMFGVDTTKPGAQEYYDSVFAQIAAWGVDFIKVDDIARPYHEHQSEIEAVRKAIDHTGRPIVLSLSPGETALSAAEHVARHANMWRISDDFWDSWPLLLEQFERCHKWENVTGPGHFPDADMLPLGRIRFGEKTHFTLDEQVTMLTLWSIFRSPLMLGCDLTQLDTQTLKLITNPEVIAVNQSSHGGHQVRRDADSVVWMARGSRKGEAFVALFNISESAQVIGFDFSELGLSGAGKLRDLWTRQDLDGTFTAVRATVPAHGASLVKIR
jgi:hypothetical protein